MTDPQPFRYGFGKDGWRIRELVHRREELQGFFDHRLPLSNLPTAVCVVGHLPLGSDFFAVYVKPPGGREFRGAVIARDTYAAAGFNPFDAAERWIGVDHLPPPVAPSSNIELPASPLPIAATNEHLSVARRLFLMLGHRANSEATLAEPYLSALPNAASIVLSKTAPFVMTGAPLSIKEIVHRLSKQAVAAETESDQSAVTGGAVPADPPDGRGTPADCREDTQALDAANVGLSEALADLRRRIEHLTGLAEAVREPRQDQRPAVDEGKLQVDRAAWRNAAGRIDEIYERVGTVLGRMPTPVGTAASQPRNAVDASSSDVTALGVALRDIDTKISTLTTDLATARASQGLFARRMAIAAGAAALAILLAGGVAYWTGAGRGYNAAVSGQATKHEALNKTFEELVKTNAELGFKNGAEHQRELWRQSGQPAATQAIVDDLNKDEVLRERIIAIVKDAVIHDRYQQGLQGLLLQNPLDFSLRPLNDPAHPVSPLLVPPGPRVGPKNQSNDQITPPD